MEKTAQVLFILVLALIADQVECKPKFRNMPSDYDNSVTLKMKSVRRYYDYMDMEWTTRSAGSCVIKIDVDAKRYQKCKKGVLQQVQRMEEDGKVWTYDIDASTSSCKRYLYYESLDPNGYFKGTGELPKPGGSIQKQETTNGKMKTTYYEYFYDLAGNWKDTWVVVLDLATNSYLPVKHVQINDDDDYEGGKSVDQTSFEPTSMMWMDLPEYCRQ